MKTFTNSLTRIGYDLLTLSTNLSDPGLIWLWLKMGVFLICLHAGVTSISQSITYGYSYDISNDAFFKSKFYTGGEESWARDITFSADGTRVFIVGDAAEVNQYSLSTAYDLRDGMTHDGVLDISGEESNPTGIAFSTDGMIMLVTGTGGDAVSQYSLTNAFTITTGVSHDGSFSVAIETTLPYGIAFNPDGSKMYINGAGTVYQYSVFGFNVVSGFPTYDNVSFSLSDVSGSWGITFSSDGHKMLVLGSSTDEIHQYSLTTGYDLSTASYDGNPFSVSNVEASPYGLDFNADGRRMFVIGRHYISQFDLNNGFEETVENDGSVDGSLHIVVSAETFTNVGGSLTFNTDYSFSNLPTGLVPSLIVSAGGDYATLTFSGNAADHQNSNDIAGLNFTFANSAFTGNDASSVSNAVGTDSGIGVNFDDNQRIVLYGNAFDLTNGATYAGNPFNSGIGSAHDVTFSPDGTKMFIAGEATDAIFQFTMNSPFDATKGANLDGSFSVATQSTRVYGMAFSNDGMKMFVVGTTNNRLNQYSLTTPFDVTSGVMFDDQLNILAQESNPTDIAFDGTGTKMFVIGSSGDEVNQFTLSDPFNISETVIYDGLFSVSAQETNPDGLAFSPDGKTMFVIGSTQDGVQQYDLTTPWDVTSGVTHEGNLLDVSGEETTPRGLAFNPGGNRLYIIGQSSTKVTQYEINIGGFNESAANDGSVEGNVPVAIVDEYFSNPGGSLTEGVEYYINNLPVGVSTTFSVSPDGRSGTLSISGQVADHQDADDINSLEIGFNNTAFSEGDASVVANATDADSKVSIDFQDNKEITFGNIFSLIHGMDFNDKVAIQTFDQNPYDIEYSDDGTRFFVLGLEGKSVIQFSISDPNIVTGGFSYQGEHLISGEVSSPQGFTFGNEGNTLFIAGNGSRIYQYSLSTPYTVTSGVTYNGDYYVASQDVSPMDVAFNTAGTKMFVVGTSTDAVHQFSLTIPWDITSGVSADGVSFTVSAEDSNPRSLFFNPEGMRMFVFGDVGDAVYQYSLTTSFDLTAGVNYDGISASPIGVSNVYGANFSGDGQKLLFGVYQSVYEYDLIRDEFSESPANDGTVEGFQVINLIKETFSNAGSALSHSVDYSINNLPAGLNPTLEVASDGHSGTLSLSGTADDHQDVDDIANLNITFMNSAFVGNDAGNVLNSMNSDIAGVDFEDNNPSITYGNRFDISGPKYLGESFNLTSEDASPTAFAFNDAGTRLFMLGNAGDAVYQYDLISPFDIGQGVTYTGVSFGVGGEESTPLDIVFSADGSKMFIIGSSDKVHQYSLTSPYDIGSGVSYDGSPLSVSGQDIQPTGLAFNNDGTEMFMLGTSGDEVNQYSLSNPFDITSGVNFEGQPLSIASEENNPVSLAFSYDGSKMFIVGYSGDDVNQYDLNKPFEITSGVSLNEARFNFNQIESTPLDFAFSSDGGRLYIMGSSDYSIKQLDLDIGGFIEAAQNDGTPQGLMSIHIDDEQFTHTGGELTVGTDFVIENLPAGMTPSMTVSADGHSADLTISGPATAHQNSDDLSSLIFTFNNSAFSGGDAAAVSNALTASSGIGIDFRDNIPAIRYGDVFDPSIATNSGVTLDLSVDNLNAYGFTFSRDGHKMFVTDADNVEINQYSLTIPYDLSQGISPDGIIGLATDLSYPASIEFSTDGSRFFVLDEGDYSIKQYSLTAPFDLLSGMSLEGSLTGIDGEVPYDFMFDAAGNKLFLAGDANSQIIEYDVSSPFDLVSGVSLNGYLTLEEDNLYPLGLTFSKDGRHLLILGDNGGYGVFLYKLNAAYRISEGGQYTGKALDIVTANSNPWDISVSPSGDRIFLLDVDNEIMETYIIDIGGFEEAVSNDGAVQGSMSLTLFDDTFSNPGGNLSYGSDYSITNLPAGLIPDLIISPDGYSAALTFAGNASVHQDATDIEGLIFTFENTAFSENNAPDVSGAVDEDSNIGIDFLINVENDILSFSVPEELEEATIDPVNHQIDMIVIAGTSLMDLSPTVSVSDGASITPESGVSRDFSTQVTYVVTAEDGTPQNWEIMVTEQQVAPTDIQMDMTSIDENNSVGAVIGTFTSVDANTSNTHTYNLISGTGDDDNGSFSIVGNELQASIAFDFETRSSYSILVQINDGNGGSFEKQFTIDIVDVNEPPTDIILSQSSIEESSIAGTYIGSLSVVDEDLGQSHSFALVSGFGDTDNSAFAITGSDLVSNEIFDFETKSSYSIRIRADDSNGATMEKVFQVSINDLPPSVTSLSLDNMSIDEKQPVGTTIGTFSTIGEDLSGNFTYTLVNGSGDDDNGSFMITENLLQSATVFDFETKNNYFIRVKTEDGNGVTREAEFVISVNDIFESSDANILSFELAEQTGPGIIDVTSHSIEIEVIYGADLTQLTPQITLSDGAFVTPTSAQDFSSPVTYIVTADDGITMVDWTVIVSMTPNEETDILAFEISSQITPATINNSNHTVNLEVEYGTDLTHLTPIITLSNGATVTPQGTVDFSVPVTFTVTAEDGVTVQDWMVTVFTTPNSETDILGFELTDQTGPAVIDASNASITVEVENGTDLSNLTPIITVSPGASISPNAVFDFTGPVTFTVTAEDGMTLQSWVVTVSMAPSQANDIVSFSVNGQSSESVIDQLNHMVTLEMPFGTDVSSLTPVISVSDNASIDPESGATLNFTETVIYMVTAEDGTIQEWNVMISVAPNSENDIIEFALDGQVGNAVIDTDQKTITIEVESGTDISQMLPSMEISSEATVIPDGSTALDFSQPVSFTVTAENGVQQEWLVIVLVQEEPLGFELRTFSVNVWPNPTTDQVFVDCSPLDNMVELRLFDLNGGEIEVENENQGLIRLDIRELPQGVYILQIFDPKNKTIHNNRIVKTR